MASREKRPLAPSKSKQKVNNDCTLPSIIDQRNRKGKNPTNTRQQQIAQDILEAVATGSELPVKLNASLPRKKAIKNLRRKPKLKTTKGNLIKVKITKKAPIRALRKTNAETIRAAVKGRRTKKTLEVDKTIDTEVIENPDNDNGGVNKSGSKNTIKNSLKSKKLKYPVRTSEADNCIIEIPGEETDATNSTVINSRNSPKTGRKVKITLKKSQNLDNEDTEDSTSLETEAKYNKSCKVGVAKKSNKEKEDNTADATKNLRLKRNTSKERDVQNNTRSNANATDTSKSIKAISDNKTLVDLTIDQVIASTVGGSAVEESQGSAKKLRRGRKVSERLLSESEIKKETDIEERESDSETSKGNQISKDMSQSSSESLKNTVPRTRYNRTSAQRSLRNGKLRKPSEFGISTDPETNKQFKLDPDEQTGSDTCAGDSSIDIIEGESFFYETNLDSSQENMNSTKGENLTGTNNKSLLKNFEDDDNNGIEVGNNNNGERGERTNEVGPTLRSKTKAKTTDPTAASLGEVKSSNEVKAEEIKFLVKSSGTQDDSKKSTSIEHTRKENILVNISDKPKSRRSSLNVEMKKTVGSFYGSDKSDNPKSQIDQMIENIKLNIAKSIESKIFGPEKSLVLNKNFEISKTEEIVAPLSTESQKKNLDEKVEDLNSPNISKTEIKSENSENAVPKVADTAKKIEKMVMGDMERADTQSQKRQQQQQQNINDNSSVATPSHVIKVSESEDSQNPESIHVGFSNSGKERIQVGNCSSDFETNKNDESGESVEIVIEEIEEDELQLDESQSRVIDVAKKMINTRQSGVTSTEKSSNTISKSVEKSQSLTEITLDIEKGKRLLIVLDKTGNTNQKSLQNVDNNLTNNGSDLTSGNKDSSNRTLNYEIFKQELKDDSESVVATPSDVNITPKSTGSEDKSPAISDNAEIDVTAGTVDAENEGHLNTTMQSEESETLESISREVERLVAESETEPSKIVGSTKEQFQENIDSCSSSINSGKNAKSRSDNCNKNSTNEDFNDIVDTDAETNRFLEALESSFTESDILNMTPDISEVLATKEEELPQSDSVYSKETLDFEKFSQESAEDAERRRNNSTASSKDQDTVYSYESTLNGQEKILSSQNLSVIPELSHENADEPSQSKLSHFSNTEETTDLQNSNAEQSSNGNDGAEGSKDESTSENKTAKNLESLEELGNSAEDNRNLTVLGETLSEKETNNQAINLLVSVDGSCTNPTGDEGVMKRDSQVDNIEKEITANEQQISLNEENKRVLRARDKQKKVESGRKSQETVVHNIEIVDKSRSGINASEDSDKAEIIKQVDLQVDDNGQELSSSKRNNPEGLANADETERTEVDKQEAEERGTATGPLIRTRRSREVKKRKDEQQQMQIVQKSKRSKRDNKKSDQQNKEETLLDNEVAKINENTQSLTEKYQKGYKGSGNFRGFSEGGTKTIFSSSKARKNDNDRSHSETDLEMVKLEMENVELSKKQSDNMPVLSEIVENQSRNSETASENDKKIMEDNLKTPDNVQKDLDETSTSSESSSSATVTSKILETPEDKVKKESILRLLGLESLEKAAERLNHQKAKKEQYTGTLKTVIRVQKEKDKKRSRSPLKMVLKQGRSDGDGDSPEFYTIQKELGTSGLGDSSSGANRKFSTNHRHSCDEDPEETPSKDRQSLVIPEKSSSFSIHPGRLCADVCCYCFGKFGSLDTPMHLAQMKSDERRKKILNVERHLTKDSCLCDACYRHVDRKANTSPTNVQSKPPRQHRQLMVSKCSARDCREPARHHVKRRWLLKIKAGLQNQVDWESTQHTSMSLCVDHYSKIERFLTCALCKRRLARNHTHQLVATETEELNDRLRQQGIPVSLSAGTFVCKLCRYFTQLQLKYKDIENMNTNHKSFFKNYRKQILHYNNIEVLENEEEDSSSQSQPTKDKEKRKKSKYGQGKSGSSKSLDSTQNSTSEKSTPEPNKNEGMSFETDNESFGNRTVTNEKIRNQDDNACRDIQILNVEDSIENLKKRKSQDIQTYTNSSTFSSESTNDLVEILAMDKEVTLTRLPKRARTNSDITPVVQRLGANPSISVRTLFPGEEEMNLHANVEFNNVREVTPQGWEKCATMIQYDRDTKLLWQELQRPYGNQSSFLRHLILLEKYYRSGDLVLAPNASRNAINYSTSVQNRLISYEGPEKVDEPILEPISSEFASPRRLSGGFVMERDRLSMPSTSSFSTNTTISSHLPTSVSSISTKTSPPRILKLNSGVSIIKKPPPNLHRLNLPSTSTSGNVNIPKRNKDNRMPVMSGGKVFQLSEPEYKKLQNLKRQKQMQLNDKQQIMPNVNLTTTNSSGSLSQETSLQTSGGSSSSSRPATQYQKAQMAAHTQFQKHLRMQQEMLNRQSRSDFEPLICDVRSLTNENNPTQHLLSNLNLPKSIQVTTKPPNTIPILPKIPRSLTVIPQTITRPADK